LLEDTKNCVADITTHLTELRQYWQDTRNILKIAEEAIKEAKRTIKEQEDGLNSMSDEGENTKERQEMQKTITEASELLTFLEQKRQDSYTCMNNLKKEIFQTLDGLRELSLEKRKKNLQYEADLKKLDGAYQSEIDKLKSRQKSEWNSLCIERFAVTKQDQLSITEATEPLQRELNDLQREVRATQPSHLSSGDSHGDPSITFDVQLTEEDRRSLQEIKAELQRLKAGMGVSPDSGVSGQKVLPRLRPRPPQHGEQQTEELDFERQKKIVSFLRTEIDELMETRIKTLEQLEEIGEAKLTEFDREYHLELEEITQRIRSGKGRDNELNALEEKIKSAREQLEAEQNNRRKQLDEEFKRERERLRHYIDNLSIPSLIEVQKMVLERTESYTAIERELYDLKQQQVKQLVQKKIQLCEQQCTAKPQVESGLKEVTSLPETIGDIENQLSHLEHEMVMLRQRMSAPYDHIGTVKLRHQDDMNSIKKLLCEEQGERVAQHVARLTSCGNEQDEKARLMREQRRKAMSLIRGELVKMRQKIEASQEAESKALCDIDDNELRKLEESLSYSDDESDGVRRLKLTQRRRHEEIRRMHDDELKSFDDLQRDEWLSFKSLDEAWWIIHDQYKRRFRITRSERCLSEWMQFKKECRARCSEIQSKMLEFVQEHPEL